MEARAQAGRGWSAGFSLLELFVVLLVIGMIAAMAVPRLSGALESARVLAGASEVRATFARARALAAAGSRERSVTFDPSQSDYGVDGERRRPLPAGVGVASARIGETVADGAAFRVRFFPEGTADRAEIALSAHEAAAVWIVVNPLTGLAETRR